MSDLVSIFRFVSLDEAAALAGVSPVTLARHAGGTKPARCLVGFPAPARRGRGQRLAWVLADVQAWIDAQRTYTAPQPAPTGAGKRRPGRPRLATGGGA
ncbi:MAG: DNA-binding protein [Pseudomonadota bacterium]